MEIERTVQRVLPLALSALLLTACGPSQFEQELASKNKSLQQQNTNLQHEFATLKTTLQTALDEANGQVQSLTAERDTHAASMQALSGERQHLTQTITDLQARLTATEAARSRVGARLAQVQQERDRLAGQVETLLAAKSQVGARLAQVQISLDTTDNRLAQIQAARSQVGARLAQVQQDRDWLETRYDNLYAAKSQVGARLALMQVAYDASNNRMDQLQAARSSVGARLAELTLQADTRERELTTVSAARDVAISQWQTLQDQLLIAHQTRQHLDAQLAAAIAARDSAVADLAAARNQLTASHAMNQNMAVLMATVGQVQRLEQANAGLVAEIQRLQEDKSALETQFHDFVSSRDTQNQALQAQIDHLAEQLNKPEAATIEATLPAPTAPVLK